LTHITLENIGKRFRYEWIFRHVSYHFERGKSYALLGANGSGKSTLLQIISGSMQASEGSLQFNAANTPLPDELFYAQLSWVAPAVELIEDFTLVETLRFHTQFKPLLPSFNMDTAIAYMQLETSRDKALRYFSSGMKQRVKLGLALLSQTPVILLDEPTMNLDSKSTQWYLDTVEKYSADKLLIIASNQAHEYAMCQHQLKMDDFKR
jgi:ABC-type multidrug transport system ATPase subunit